MNNLFSVGDDIIKYKNILREIWNHNPKNIILLDSHFIKCHFNDNIILVFNIIIGKLAKISYHNNYNDEIVKNIRLGMTIHNISNSYLLNYDEDENFYSLNDNEQVALFFENPYQSISENPQNRLVEVTIYDKSLLFY